MLYIVFNNKNSLEDLGLGILKKNEHYRTREEVEYVNIEGRKEGSLTIKTGNFKDLVINRTFRIIDNEDYNLKLLKINRWLNKIENNKLYFSDYPEKCYIVKNAEIKSISDDNRNIFDIAIEFYCEPFLRETNEDMQGIKTRDIIYNFGDEESNPIINLELGGNAGMVRISINGKTLDIPNVKGNLYIDSSIFKAISEGKEVRTIGNFPTLAVGENEIILNGAIVKAYIKKNSLFRG